MSVNGVMHFAVDLDKPLKRVDLGTLMSEDQAEDSYLIHLTHGGVAADLTGAVVACYMVRADRTTLIWSGDVQGDAAALTIPRDGHHVPGRFALSVTVARGQVSHTVLLAEGEIRRKLTDSQYTPAERSVPNTADLMQLAADLAGAVNRANAAASAANAAAARVPVLSINRRGDLEITL